MCTSKCKESGRVVKWTNLTFPFGKSAFHYVLEYLGRLFGLVYANTVAKVDKVNAVRRQAIRWVGDYTSALVSAETGKAASKFDQMANVAVAWAQLYGEYAVDSTEQLAGAQMGDIDGATRHKFLTSLHQEKFVSM